MTDAEQRHEHDRDALCPYCHQRECVCEADPTCDHCDESPCICHTCDLCGALASVMVVTESIGGERDEILHEELWLCEECKESG